MNETQRQATTSAIAQLVGGHLLAVSTLLEMQRTEAIVSNGLALEEVTNIIEKMVKECKLKIESVVKILKEGSVIQQYAFSYFFLVS